MENYETPEMLTINGRFIGFISGYYTFHLENEEIIAFDEVNSVILRKIDLKNVSKNTAFKITYSEIFNDVDIDEFLIFRLEKLEEI